VDEAEEAEPQEEKKKPSAAQKKPVEEKEEKLKDVKFESPQDFVIVQIADREAKPDEVKMSSHKFKSLTEAN